MDTRHYEAWHGQVEDQDRAPTWRQIYNDFKFAIVNYLSLKELQNSTQRKLTQIYYAQSGEIPPVACHLVHGMAMQCHKAEQLFITLGMIHLILSWIKHIVAHYGLSVKSMSTYCPGNKAATWDETISPT